MIDECARISNETRHGRTDVYRRTDPAGRISTRTIDRRRQQRRTHSRLLVCSVSSSDVHLVALASSPMTARAASIRFASPLRERRPHSSESPQPSYPTATNDERARAQTIVSVQSIYRARTRVHTAGDGMVRSTTCVSHLDRLNCVLDLEQSERDDGSSATDNNVRTHNKRAQRRRAHMSHTKHACRPAGG
jgi:hypothetical protein